MRIGVIGGSGPAGSALGARLASVGYEVVIGSRSKYRAMETRDEIVAMHPELESLLDYGENTVAADCDLVVIATPWDSAATMAQALASHLEGKIVVSMANALVRVGSEFEPLIPPRGSVAAHVQAAAPRSRVVAAFHHLPAKELGAIGQPIDSDVLICADDPVAVSAVSEIAAKIPGCRPLDAGESAAGGRPDRLGDQPAAGDCVHRAGRAGTFIRSERTDHQHVEAGEVVGRAKLAG